MACNTGSGDNSERAWCIKKTDTLWMTLAKVRKNFVYKMDEIAIRKAEMDSQLQQSKYFQESQLSETDKANLIQYSSVLAVYKPIANQYKEAVLEAEELFFEIKALDKSVKSGYYDKKIADFKTEWNKLNEELNKNALRATDIATRLNSVEPMYLRLEPKIAEIMERLVP